MIYKYSDLQEGKVYKITHSSWSRNDPEHWANWYYYLHKGGDDYIFINFYRNYREVLTAVSGPVSLMKHKKSLQKQLFKEIDYFPHPQHTFIEIVFNNKFMIYKI